jgi:naphthoate synthase
VTSFDGGYGSILKWWDRKKLVKFSLGRVTTQDAMDMGMVNAVPHAELEDTAYEWAQEILGKSPMAIKC